MEQTEYREFIREKLAEMNLSDIEQILDDTIPESEQIFGDVNAGSLIDNILAGEALFNTDEIIANVMQIFTYELRSALILGVEIVTVTILIGMLKSISSSFGERAVSNLGQIVSTCFIIGLCLSNFKLTFDLCGNSVNTMTHTMQVLLPILLPMLIASGGLSSGGLLSPVLTGAITVFSTAMANIILPAIFVSTVFYMVNSMTDRGYVNKLAGFIRSAAIFLCGICVTFFTGITVIQGFVAEAADGLLVETARFSVSNLIPIVGSFASDSLDMVIMCVRLIKNGIGILGVIILLTLLIVPMIKLLAIAVMYKITAIITEPLGNKQISDCLSEMGTSVITMTVILFLTSMMFIFFITIIIGIGV